MRLTTEQTSPLTLIVCLEYIKVKAKKAKVKLAEPKMHQNFLESKG